MMASSSAITGGLETRPTRVGRSWNAQALGAVARRLDAGAIEQFSAGHLEGAGEADDGFEGGEFLSAFDAADVVEVEVGFLGEVDLAQAGFQAELADGASEMFGEMAELDRHPLSLPTIGGVF